MRLLMRKINKESISKLKNNINKKLDKTKYRRLSTYIVITVIILIIFSIPLDILQGLGGIIFPSSGLWNVPGEVPAEERLVIPGFKGNVTVFRDEWGVPHIYSDYEKDMFFAQGYCHAQDRYFQMDMIRRQVRGMLSEIVGESALAQDKYNLAMGMEYWANETDKVISKMAFYENLESYVAGVNYYLQTHKSEKPLEYQLLGFEPTNWSTLDSLCLVQEMARQLSWGYDDIYRMLNYDALGSGKFNELFGLPLPYQIPICPNYGSFGEIPEAAGTIEVEITENPPVISAMSDFITSVNTIDSERELIEFQDIRGSNNWVISGKKSNTGMPILCNDMHLSWIMPGVWYEQHLVAKDTGLNVYGFSVPGMPLVAVGHNQYIAWGFTNTGYDVLDWYYYKTFGSDEYIYNGKMKEFTTRTHIINVKGQAPVEFTVRLTVHGPVLSDLRDFNLPTSNENIVIAAKWTGQGIYYNFLAGNGFNHAKNRAQFDSASRYWTTLAQNIVYADIYGNIAIRPTGKVPIRSNFGKFPYDGSIGEGEWTGYIAFEDLPNTINPDQEFLASSNQIIAGPNYPYKLQSTYSEGYRARRINEYLSTIGPYENGIEKMKKLQHDVKSSCAEAYTPYLINAIESYYGSNAPTQIQSILKELKGWNYFMFRDLAAPTIYRKFRDYLYEYTFNDEFEYYDAILGPNLAVLENLMKEEPNSHWFDDINTLLIKENRDDIIIKALQSTIVWLENYYHSSDPSTWRWGDVHKLYFTHLTGLDALSKGPYEGDGEEVTVMPSGINMGTTVSYAMGGASERMIVDLSNLNNSMSVIPSGERGLSNSKHYSDQLEQLYLQYKYHYQYFTNTINNFPSSSIESRIYFTTTGGS